MGGQTKTNLRRLASREEAKAALAAIIAGTLDEYEGISTVVRNLLF
jgi:hypothetical protein